MKLVAPHNKRRFEVIVVGTGLAGARRGGHARRARLRRQGVHVPRLAAARALDRRAGRHQRRQELQGRRRHDLPPLLRHGEGRRLPLPRGERLPARPDVGRHHRPVRRAGRAVRPRVRRPARQPLASAARRCRARSTPAARPASSSCSARTRRSPARSARAPSSCYTATEMLDLVVKDGARRAASSPATWSPARSARTPRTRSCSPPAATATSSSSRPTPRRRNATAIWRAHRRGALFANPCFTQIHPTCIPASDDFQSKLTLMSESLRNDGRIWVPKKMRRPALARPDPRGRARLLPRAPVPRVRQPRAARRRVARDQDEVDDGRGVGPLKNGVYLDFADAIERLGRDVDRGALRQPLRDVRAHHRRGPVQGADAHLPGRPLHDGRAVGGLRPA